MKIISILYDSLNCHFLCFSTILIDWLAVDFSRLIFPIPSLIMMIKQRTRRQWTMKNFFTLVVVFHWHRDGILHRSKTQKSSSKMLKNEHSIVVDYAAEDDTAEELKSSEGARKKVLSSSNQVYLHKIYIDGNVP